MNAELKKNMGLEIGRAIHLNGPNPDDLYEEIMKVATAFVDLSHTSDLLQTQVAIEKGYVGADDETKEIIPDN